MAKVFNIIFRKKTSRVTYCFYYIVEFSITFPAIYVSIKKLCSDWNCILVSVLTENACWINYYVSLLLLCITANVYNIPICIWVMDSHPHNPPMVYVRPTSTMQIKEGRNVDRNGKIDLPYLREWKYVSFCRIKLKEFNLPGIFICSPGLTFFYK